MTANPSFSSDNWSTKNLQIEKENKMLTYDEFIKIPNGSDFSKGEIIDSPYGLNMTNSGKMLKWIAVKGHINDWCIYAHFANNDFYYVRSSGDKVLSEDNIRMLVPCDDEVFENYRY